MNKLIQFCIILSLAAFAGLPARAHEGEQNYSAGRPGDPKKPARAVIVTMKETDDGKMLFTPSSVSVKKDEQVRFILVNSGRLKHEFMLASIAENDKHAVLMQKYPDMEHDDANGKTLEPGTRTEMVWKFSTPGTFEFACLIPGHRESGMHGAVNVK
jgi:uncharacterized cupredoxin-like copper-binding protein